MEFTCPYCGKVSEISLLGEAEVRQSEYNMAIWHTRCKQCHNKFRIIERQTTTYEVEEITER
jgi:sarcosine oxidase delta subunit